MGVGAGISLTPAPAGDLSSLGQHLHLGRRWKVASELQSTCYFLRSAPFFRSYRQMYSSKMREKTQKEENVNPRKWKESPWPWAIKEPGYLRGQSLVAAPLLLLLYTGAPWPIQRWATALVVLLFFCPTQVRRIITKVPYETAFGVVSHSHLVT